MLGRGGPSSTRMVPARQHELVDDVVRPLRRTHRHRTGAPCAGGSMGLAASPALALPPPRIAPSPVARCHPSRGLRHRPPVLASANHPTPAPCFVRRDRRNVSPLPRRRFRRPIAGTCPQSYFLSSICYFLPIWRVLDVSLRSIGMHFLASPRTNPEIPMPALPTTIVAERRPPAPNGHDTTNNRRNWTTNRAETAPHRHDRPRPQARSCIIAEHRCENELEKSPSFRAKSIHAFLRICN
jgi:hypothetical protein